MYRYVPTYIQVSWVGIDSPDDVKVLAILASPCVFVRYRWRRKTPLFLLYFGRFLAKLSE